MIKKILANVFHFLFVSSCSQKQRESVISHLETLSLKPNNQVRNLRVILDSDLNFSSHIKSITSAAFYHLKNIARIKGIASKPGKAAFQFYAPKIWNSLPEDVRLASTLTTFKSRRKTVLFSCAFLCFNDLIRLLGILCILPWCRYSLRLL